MKNPFRSKYRITQNFGERPDYYKQFGLKGHEGIDLVPTGTDLAIYALADGIVVKDDDIAGDPRTDAYGKNCTIWHPTLRKATQYCHLSDNSVSLGQQVKQGDAIGFMGSTGNTQGAHLHLNLFETDANGIRLNKDNGFLGGIDPISFLESDDPIIDITLQEELNKVRKERDENHNDRMALYEELGFTGIFIRQRAVDEIRRLKSVDKDYEEKVRENEIAKGEIDRLRIEIDRIQKDHIEFAAQSTETIQLQQDKIESLSKGITDLEKQLQAPRLKGIRKLIYLLLIK